MTDEKINHPQHYGGDTLYEPIKVIEAWNLGFCLGNTVKYVYRAGKKPGASTLEDLQKARWYLDRYIAYVQANMKAEASLGAWMQHLAETPSASNGQEVGIPLKVALLVCPWCHQQTSMEREVASWRCDACHAYIKPNDPGFDEICKILNPASQLPKEPHEKY